MDYSSADVNENCVNEGSFWHTNLDLYFGYQPGEVVEVEHEPNKYWLAIIRYSFRQLLSLDWVGDYGNFWIDLSNINASSSALTVSEGYYTPRRLFPLGHHLQSQLKSQFNLVKPTKVLIKPTLYDPKADPFGNINDVKDLLELCPDQINPKDKYRDQGSSNRNETNNLEITKACRPKLSYGQEDADELEAALQNLNGELSETIPIHQESLIIEQPCPPVDDITECSKEVKSATDSLVQRIDELNDSKSNGLKLTDNEESTENHLSSTSNLPEQINPLTASPDDKKSTEGELDLEILNLCKNLQQTAIANGNYNGLGKDSDKTFLIKPKQFYDIGGANHERLIVPGTLLEICNFATHPDEYPPLEFNYWFAFVLKNNGGLLTLRWFLCDDPKFRQGRLELKCSKSQFISELSTEDNNTKQDHNNGTSQDGDKDSDSQINTNKDPRLAAKEITFSMHFCDIRISSISQNAGPNQRSYKMPEKMISIIKQLSGDEVAQSIHKNHMDHIYDPRRMNLDKDRPLIDHLYKIIDAQRPNYVHIEWRLSDNLNGQLSTNQLESCREVLISTPQHIKLLRGFVKYQLAPGVYEIHSEPATSNGKFIKFVYPFDSSYSVLPISWSEKNENCISAQISRTSSPNFLSQSMRENNNDNSEEKQNPQQLNDVTQQGDKQQANSIIDADQSDSGLDSICKQEPVTDPKTTTTTATELVASQKEPETFEPLTQEPSIVVANEKNDTTLNAIPQLWTPEKLLPHFACEIDKSHRDHVVEKFKNMEQLEVLHHSGSNLSDANVCQGRIRKVVYPLLWIQISPDSYCLLPFNSTCIYPSGWAQNNEMNLISLLPPVKRPQQAPSAASEKRRKRVKLCDDKSADDKQLNPADQLKYQQMLGLTQDRDDLDLDTIQDKPLDISLLLKDDIMLDRIYFNHKCFTGPSLSKGKICSLPQYVGPGPLRLVLEEVVTKIISVAYVPPRILNDLSSKNFEDLLIERNLVNTLPVEFKAKYQKRVHREDIQVCIDPNDVALYCECICEHLKCCYNLFGPNLYDGDDCPGHCRALTKSNKFMKRATYYREKARLGEFTSNDNNNANKKVSSNKTQTKASQEPKNQSTGTQNNEQNGQTETTSSSSSSSIKSDNIESRPASCFEDPTPNLLTKENIDQQQKLALQSNGPINTGHDGCIMREPTPSPEIIQQESSSSNIMDNSCGSLDVDMTNIMDVEPQRNHIDDDVDFGHDDKTQNMKFHLTNQRVIKTDNRIAEPEFQMLESNHIRPEQWSIMDVVHYLERSRLHKFKKLVITEHIDGQALLLLDRLSIREHFQSKPKNDLSHDEISKFYRFVEYVKTHMN